MDPVRDLPAQAAEQPPAHPTIAVDAAVPNLLMIFPGTTIAQAQRELVLVTLRHVGGRKVLAADMLGVSLKTLYNWLQQYQEEDRQAEEARKP